MHMSFEFFQQLRLFNVYFSIIVSVIAAMRILRIWLVQSNILKNHIKSEYNRIDLEKFVQWIALFMFTMNTAIGSLAHRLSLSSVGIYVPITTLSLVLVCLAVFISFRIKKNKEGKDDRSITQRLLNRWKLNG